MSLMSFKVLRTTISIFAIFSFTLAISQITVAAKNVADLKKVESESKQRLSNDVKKLSADEWEGRGLGSKGHDAAAQFIADEFKALGLKTDLIDGGPFQFFTVTTSSKMGPAEKNKFSFVPSSGKAIEATLNKDYRPLSLGGSGVLDMPVAFVGYGISSKDDKYDDYEGIDVNDKAVIILRHEPQQNNPHGAFEGTTDSPHAALSKKVSNAYQHGAAAVIFVTDDYDLRNGVKTQKKTLSETIEKLTKENEAITKIPESDEAALAAQYKKIAVLVNRMKELKILTKDADQDVLPPFSRGDASESRKLPVMHVRRSVVDAVLKQALDTDLVSLEKHIDIDLKPQSKIITGWKISGETAVERVEAKVKNVIGVLEGKGDKADETIVIGAHYDHLGRGGPGSFVKDSHEIHNGADDNASGTASLIETARQLAKLGPQPRRIVFIAFSGEERGLLGSSHYVHHPIFPLDKTIAMLNMDMVGRLKDNKLIISGYNTAKEFDALVTKLNKPYNFELIREGGGFGPSDHASFYAVNIPVMHFYTGLHSDYHRPSDDFDKLELDGMRRITSLVVDTAVSIANDDAKPHFTKAVYEKFKGSGPSVKGARPYFGSIPDLGSQVEGYALTGVTAGSPADLGGLKGGDIIIRLGDNKIGDLGDFDNALRKFKADDTVDVTVKRGTETLKLKVTVGAPK